MNTAMADIMQDETIRTLICDIMTDRYCHVCLLIIDLSNTDSIVMNRCCRAIYHHNCYQYQSQITSINTANGILTVCPQCERINPVQEKHRFNTYVCYNITPTISNMIYQNIEDKDKLQRLDSQLLDELGYTKYCNRVGGYLDCRQDISIIQDVSLGVFGSDFKWDGVVLMGPWIPQDSHTPVNILVYHSDPLVVKQRIRYIIDYLVSRLPESLPMLSLDGHVIHINLRGIVRPFYIEAIFSPHLYAVLCTRPNPADQIAYTGTDTIESVLRRCKSHDPSEAIRDTDHANYGITPSRFSQMLGRPVTTDMDKFLRGVFGDYYLAVYQDETVFSRQLVEHVISKLHGLLIVFYDGPMEIKIICINTGKRRTYEGTITVTGLQRFIKTITG